MPGTAAPGEGMSCSAHLGLCDGDGGDDRGGETLDEARAGNSCARGPVTGKDPETPVEGTWARACTNIHWLCGLCGNIHTGYAPSLSPGVLECAGGGWDENAHL